MEPYMDSRHWPLRRIVNRGANEYGAPTETLECGHVVVVKQDAFGHTNADRRRCRRCSPDVRHHANATRTV